MKPEVGKVYVCEYIKNNEIINKFEALIIRNDPNPLDKDHRIIEMIKLSNMRLISFLIDSEGNSAISDLIEYKIIEETKDKQIYRDKDLMPYEGTYIMKECTYLKNKIEYKKSEVNIIDYNATHHIITFDKNGIRYQEHIKDNLMIKKLSFGYSLIYFES